MGDCRGNVAYIQRKYKQKQITHDSSSVIWQKITQNVNALKVVDRIDLTKFKNARTWLTVNAALYVQTTCVLMHRCLTGAAPRYLTELAVPVASTARRCLRSVSSADFVAPSTRRSTIGDRAFAVAGPRAWNVLPSDIRTSTPSFDRFKKHLKSYLFQLSFSSL